MWDEINSAKQQYPSIGALATNVASNVLDCEAWDTLLTAVDASDDLGAIRCWYNVCLRALPLYTEFWIKYAKSILEAGLRGGHSDAIEQCVAVFELAVQSAPACPVLWRRYCEFILEMRGNSDESASVLMRAIEQVGHQPASSVIWQLAEQYFTVKGDSEGLLSLYTRAIQAPLDELPMYWDRFRQQLHEMKPATDANAAIVQAQNMIAQSGEARQLRAVYEHRLTRTTFHPAPVNHDELETWRQYLQYEESNGTATSTIQLYERSVLVCGNYHHSWSRYARWLEKNVGLASSMTLIQRWCDALPFRAEGYLRHAECLELTGDVEAARALYRRVVDQIAPDSLDAVTQFIAFEQRQGDQAAILPVYDQQLARCTGLQRVILTLRKTTFIAQGLKQPQRALALLENELREMPHQAEYLLAYLEIVSAIPTSADIEANILQLGASMLNGLTDPRERVEMIMYLLDHFRTRGASIQSVRSVQAMLDEEADKGRAAAYQATFSELEG